MICSQKYGIYNLTINAKTVKAIDRFRFSLYSSFLGDDVWGMKKIVKNTVLIDLTQSEDALLLDIKSNTRNEIRKGFRENFSFEKVPTVDDFVTFYNLFAEEKNLPTINEYSVKKFDKIFLFQSSLKDMPLVMHATNVDDENKRVMLLYSASVRFSEDFDRKNVGIANRFLHYNEFVEFKKMGYQIYDFTGVCNDPSDKERYSIGQFKRGFGGKEVPSIYLYSYPFSLAQGIKKLLSFWG